VDHRQPLDHTVDVQVAFESLPALVVYGEIYVQEAVSVGVLAVFYDGVRLPDLSGPHEEERCLPSGLVPFSDGFCDLAAHRSSWAGMLIKFSEVFKGVECKFSEVLKTSVCKFSEISGMLVCKSPEIYSTKD